MTRLFRLPALIGTLTLVAAGSAALASPPPAQRQFAGEVLQVDARSKSFTMKAGSSKKRPQVKILTDGRTRWAGLSRKGNLPRLGDRVFVVAAAKGNDFQASTVNVLDPNARPMAGPPVANMSPH